MAQAGFLRAVKQGKLDFLKVVLPALEEEMETVEALSEKSTLPETVDRKFWDKFVIKAVAETLSL